MKTFEYENARKAELNIAIAEKKNFFFVRQIMYTIGTCTRDLVSYIIEAYNQNLIQPYLLVPEYPH